MTEPVQVAAHWALWGKRPGSHDDYSVLSCSAGQFGRNDFAAIVSRYAPGTPSPRQEGPGKLPWVTLSWVGAAAKLHLGIAVQTSASQVDGAGRPIMLTSYFCVPYDAVARPAISYTSLYHEVSGIRLAEVGDEAIPLRLRPLDIEELAQALAEFGEDTVSTAASLLLAGPVSIVQAGSSGPEERLRFLDAVAALLPYGYRSKYTAATWSDSGVRHRIRLAFAERPHEGAATVVWRRHPDLSAASPVARRYLAQLLRVRGKSADSGMTVPETDLVGRLAGCAEPHGFDDPQYAIEAVRAIDLPFGVLADLRAGQADLTELRQVFDLPRIEELDQDGRRAVLVGLLGHGGPDDLPRLRQWWEPVVSDRPDAVLPALTEAARGELWAAEPSPSVPGYLELAELSGAADRLLADLITPPDSGTRTVTLDRAARLVVEWIFTDGLPKTGQRIDRLASGYPLTLAVLPANPPVACEMAAQLAATGPEARAAVSWLAKRVPDLLAPFQELVAARPRQVDAHAIANLRRSGRDCVRALISAASSLSRLDLVLPGLAAWLIAARPLGQAEALYWRDQLLAIQPAVADQARTDLALLALGSYPRWLLPEAGRLGWPEYRDAFLVLSSRLGLRPGRAGGERVGELLCAYLNLAAWPDSDGQAIAVAELIERFTAAQRNSTLVGLVGSILWNNPAAREHAAAGKWLSRIDRELIHRGVLYSLRRLRPDSQLDWVVVICERGFRTRLPADVAGRTFAWSDAMPLRPGGANALDVLRARFTADSAEPSGSAQQAQSGIKSLVGRVFGRPDAGQPDAEGDGDGLTREQREYYTRLQEWMDGFVKSAVKTWRRRMARRDEQPTGRPGQVLR